MSVNALKPTFRNAKEYRAWRKTWAVVYRELSSRIRQRKLEAKTLQRSPCPHCLGAGFFHINPVDTALNQSPSHHECECQERGGSEMAKAQKELHLMRADGRKMMTLMQEAEKRRQRIHSMREQIDEQPFPLEMEGDRVDFYFNKASIEFDVLPKWILKTKGKSFYVDHIDATIPWNTRELDSGPTLGMIRFRKCHIAITKDRVATLSPLV